MNEDLTHSSIAPFRDRRTGPILFGAILMAIGIVKIGLIVESVILPVSKNSHIMFDMYHHGGSATWMIGFGIGSILARRWARALLFCFGALGLTDAISMRPLPTMKARAILVVFLGLLVTGCATSPPAPLVPAENEPYTHGGSGEIRGVLDGPFMTVDGIEYGRTVYLLPNTAHFADWARRATQRLAIPATPPPLSEEERSYVRWTFADRPGHFSFSALPPGSYILFVGMPSESELPASVVKVVQLQDGQITELRLKIGESQRRSPYRSPPPPGEQVPEPHDNGGA
jgi:hypothetical protein